MLGRKRYDVSSIFLELALLPYSLTPIRILTASAGTSFLLLDN